MSPITPDSQLGRLIAIKKELTNLSSKISAITNMSNTNNVTVNLKVKIIVANIKRVKTLWSSYLQLFEHDNQTINEQLNSSIINIFNSGLTIKNIRINSQTLIGNLHTLSLQTTRAIIQTANLVSIIDLNERRSLGLRSNTLSRPVPRLIIPDPPPYSEPPRLQRRPNIGTTIPTSLVRQEATHSLLEDLDLTPSRASSSGSSTLSRNAFGKKYFRARKITRRKRGNKKTRRA